MGLGAVRLHAGGAGASPRPWFPIGPPALGGGAHLGLDLPVPAAQPGFASADFGDFHLPIKLKAKQITIERRLGSKQAWSWQTPEAYRPRIQQAPHQ